MIEQDGDFGIGGVVHAIENGSKVARRGWNGNGMFIYYVPAAAYPSDRNKLNTMSGVFEGGVVAYSAYVAIKGTDNIVTPWLCSQADLLAVDYYVVE